MSQSFSRTIVLRIVVCLPVLLLLGASPAWGRGPVDADVCLTVPDAAGLERLERIPPDLTVYKYLREGHGERKSALDTTALDSVIVETMAEYHIPGMAACVVHDGRVVWKGTYGYAYVEEQVEVSDSTLFMLASISKTFVAAAMMQLWEDGLFGLDDDINGYLPFAVVNPHYPDSAITFRMLLAHTSSIARNDAQWLPLVTWGADSPYPLDEFLQDWLVPGGDLYSPSNYMLYAPGTGGEYSNIAYSLAGYLVEQISGQSFEQYCQQHIFSPLGMEETSWFLAGLNIDNIAVPTGFASGEYFSYGHFGFPPYPCGQLRTSLLQLARHLIAFMQMGQIDSMAILDSATVAMMTTIQYPDVTVLPGVDWGLGWYGFETASGWWWGHEGGIYGVCTLMYYDAAVNSGVIYLTNGDGTDGHAIIALELFEFAADPDSDGVISGFDNCPYVYNPEQEDGDGDGVGDACETSVEAVDGPVANVPELVLLYPNYPNPFNPQTTISFYLPSSSVVTLSVYNTAGQRVTTLVDGHRGAGYHRCVWNGTDRRGQEVTSGVYFCRIKAGNTYRTRKMTLLR